MAARKSGTKIKAKPKPKVPPSAKDAADRIIKARKGKGKK